MVCVKANGVGLRFYDKVCSRGPPEQKPLSAPGARSRGDKVRVARALLDVRRTETFQPQGAPNAPAAPSSEKRLDQPLLTVSVGPGGQKVQGSTAHIGLLLGAVCLYVVHWHDVFMGRLLSACRGAVPHSAVAHPLPLAACDRTRRCVALPRASTRRRTDVLSYFTAVLSLFCCVCSRAGPPYQVVGAS